MLREVRLDRPVWEPRHCVGAPREPSTVCSMLLTRSSCFRRSLISADMLEPGREALRCEPKGELPPWRPSAMDFGRLSPPCPEGDWAGEPWVRTGDSGGLPEGLARPWEWPWEWEYGEARPWEWEVVGRR